MMRTREKQNKKQTKINIEHGFRHRYSDKQPVRVYYNIIIIS